MSQIEVYSINDDNRRTCKFCMGLRITPVLWVFGVFFDSCKTN